jgi:hypothetical protein
VFKVCLFAQPVPISVAWWHVGAPIAIEEGFGGHAGVGCRPALAGRFLGAME